MLSICRLIFGTGETMVLNSGFYVAKGITELDYKGVYVGYLIKKCRYCPKIVTADLIDTHFQDKEVGEVGMIEARTQENNPFLILCMKDPDYVINIMESWTTLDELEGANTRRVQQARITLTDL